MLWDDIKNDASGLGGLQLYLAVAAIFYLIGESSIAMTLINGLLICYLIAMVTKLFDRDERKYSGIYEKISLNSFPSMHSARATMLAINLGLYFNDLIISLLFAALAIGVVFSRVHKNKHQHVDTFAGAVLGIGVAWLLILLPKFI